MTSKLLSSIIIAILILSCDESESNRTIISGKLFSSEANTVFLNKIDHFDYLNDGYIIDSASVSENGEFTFINQDLDSELISLTTEKFKPFTYQIFSTAPQTYYFGNCEKFFTSIPTFYITNEKSIKVNWYETPSIDSLSSPDNSAVSQIKMREFYLNSKKIETSGLDYDEARDFKDNWELMINEKDFDIEQANLKNIDIESSFDNYLYTEIYLGHLNQFLNWFERHFPENVEASINKEKPNDFYSNIFAEYNTHKWNSKSLEYYKFTERYVNYFMNIESKSFKQYYEPSEKKRTIAEKVLSEKNKKRYLALIDKQVENVL